MSSDIKSDDECIVYYIDDKYDAVCRYLENISCNNNNLKTYKSIRIDDPYDSRCNFIFTNLAKIDFLRIGSGILVNNLKGSQHLSNKAYLAYHIKASGKEYLMPLQWSAAYNDISSLVGMLIVTTLYNYCHQLLNKKGNNTAINNDKEFKEVVQALLMDTVFRQSNDYTLLTQLLSSFPNFMNNSNDYDYDELASTLNNIDSQQNWRKSWSGQEDIWIMKPVGLSCGENIHVFKGFKDVLMHAKTMKYKCIVQKYIERPLLVRKGRKFDIRQWVLVTNVDPLIVYGFSECYLRLSSKGYTLDSQDLLDATVHLTNHAIQKNSITNNDNINDNDDESLVCDTMMTQQQFDETLKGMYQNTNTVFDDNNNGNPTSIFSKIIKPQIKKIAIDAITSVRDTLRKVGDGYQWLGLDLMVTEDDLQGTLFDINYTLYTNTFKFF